MARYHVRSSDSFSSCQDPGNSCDASGRLAVGRVEAGEARNPAGVLSGEEMPTTPPMNPPRNEPRRDAAVRPPVSSTLLAPAKLYKIYYIQRPCRVTLPPIFTCESHSWQLPLNFSRYLGRNLPQAQPALARNRLLEGGGIGKHPPEVNGAIVGMPEPL